MRNAKIPSATCALSEMIPPRRPLPVFRVGIWARKEDGTICYIAEDVPGENCWSAVGRQLLHLRAANPKITLRPDGISVVRVPGERAFPEAEETAVQ